MLDLHTAYTSSQLTQYTGNFSAFSDKADNIVFQLQTSVHPSTLFLVLEVAAMTPLLLYLCEKSVPYESFHRLEWAQTVSEST